MSILSTITGGAVENVIKAVGGIVDNLYTSEDEKNAYKIELRKLVVKELEVVNEAANEEMRVKRDIIVAELQQDDKFTKRARPWVIYSGLIAMFFNYVLFPAVAFFTGKDIPTFPLPDIFWAGWTGIVGVYSVGRTLEKTGILGKGKEVKGA